MTAIDPRVDAYLGGDWQRLDASTGGTVRQKPPIKIVQGTKDEDTEASPSKCTFTLNDPAGDYDPGNVMGQWWGDLQENTRVRVSVPLAEVANFSHSVTTAGGIEHTDFGGEYINAETRYTLTLPTSNITGGSVASTLALRWLDDDNFIGVQVLVTAVETVLVGVYDKIDAADRRLLGDTEVEGLSVASDQVLRVAVLVEGQVVRTKVWADGDPEPLDWQTTCTRATVRAGSIGIYSATTAGNTNTHPFVFGYADLAIGIPVFHGEISEFEPGVADESHAAPYVEIQASGIGRRVEQGSEPLKSSMFRAWSSTQRWVREGAVESVSSVGSTNQLQGTVIPPDSDDVPVGSFMRLFDEFGRHKEDQIFQVTANSGGRITFTPDALEPIVIGDWAASWREADATDLPLAYWPCEEEKNATSIASGLPGGAPLEIRVATPEFGELDSFESSLPLLKLNDAELYGLVPDYDDVNEAFSVHFLVHFPEDDEAASGTNFIQFAIQGGAAEVWALIYNGAGELRITAVSTGGVALFDDTWTFASVGLQGNPTGILFTLFQSGASTVDYNLFVNGALGAGVATGVPTIGKITTVRVNPNGSYIETGFGHLSVTPKRLDYFNIRDQLEAYALENVPRRLIRLAYEEREPLVYCQGPIAADQLGIQQRDTLLDNWQSAVDFDGGRFHESRGAYSFEYRSRASLYNQEPILEVDYAGGAVLADLVPTRDDQATRNDVTVKRDGGSSARATRDTGPKSVEAVGRYTDAPTLNAGRDSQLPDLASWRLHLGTVAEDRYPTIRITSANGAVTLERLLSVGVGDRVKVTNAGVRRRFEPIDQLIPGYTLTLHRYVPVLEMNCIPASPYQVAVLDDPGVRLDSDTSTLDVDITTTATEVDVATAGGTLWVTTATHPAEFPFDVLIGGERCTVTAISGVSSPQTFTVTRSVNAVVKAWTAGTKVSLADPYYLPL